MDSGIAIVADLTCELNSSRPEIRPIPQSKRIRITLASSCSILPSRNQNLLSRSQSLSRAFPSDPDDPRHPPHSHCSPSGSPAIPMRLHETRSPRRSPSPADARGTSPATCHQARLRRRTPSPRRGSRAVAAVSPRLPSPSCLGDRRSVFNDATRTSAMRSSSVQVVEMCLSVKLEELEVTRIDHSKTHLVVDTHCFSSARSKRG